MANNKKPLFVGLDLSLTGTGIVILDFAGRVLHHSIISTKPTTQLPQDRFKRYASIWKAIQKIMKEYLYKNTFYQFIAIESYSFGSKGSARSSLMESGAVIRYELLKNFPSYYIEVAPQQLKKFLLGSVKNKGKDAKNIMCREVYKRGNLELDNDNEVDAYVLAMIGYSLHFQSTKSKMFHPLYPYHLRTTDIEVLKAISTKHSLNILS